MPWRNGGRSSVVNRSPHERYWRTGACIGKQAQTGRSARRTSVQGYVRIEAVFAEGEHRFPLSTGSHAVQDLQLAAGAKRDDNAIGRQVQLLELGR
jgi:hypothetical protein